MARVSIVLCAESDTDIQSNDPGILQDAQRLRRRVTEVS